MRMPTRFGKSRYLPPLIGTPKLAMPSTPGSKRRTFTIAAVLLKHFTLRSWSGKEPRKLGVHGTLGPVRATGSTATLIQEEMLAGAILRMLLGEMRIG